MLVSVNKALSPFSEFTDILLREGYVTVSSLKPLLQHLANILKEEKDDTQLTKDIIKSGILTDLSQTHEDLEASDLVDMAMFLDPRFKLNYLDNEYVLDAEAVKEQVTQEGTMVARR